jgi:hypothetical protein
MKLPKLPKLSYKGYVRYLRKQSIYMQQLHALVFAATITGVTAFLILYYDYGFFHDVYIQKSASAEEQTADIPSPMEAFTSFLSEAKGRFESIGQGGSGFLEGKATYVNTNAGTP